MLLDFNGTLQCSKIPASQSKIRLLKMSKYLFSPLRKSVFKTQKYFFQFKTLQLCQPFPSLIIERGLREGERGEMGVYSPKMLRMCDFCY